MSNQRTPTFAVSPFDGCRKDADRLAAALDRLTSSDESLLTECLEMAARLRSLDIQTDSVGEKWLTPNVQTKPGSSRES